METKDNLKPTGCLARALPHEPMFILLARDVAAPPAIRAWCDLRLKMPSADSDLEQIHEALATADTFENWRQRYEGDWRGQAPHLPDLIPTPTDEISSIAGRINGSKPLPGEGEAVAKFNRLLADAKRLAGFTMRSDRQAGPNEPDARQGMD
jgi:hypothetical protein